MTDALFIFLGTVIGSLLTFAGQIIVASFSAKSKREKDAALSEMFLKLSSMSAKELEERINLISKLDDRINVLTEENRNLRGEILEIKQSRIERDAELEAMQSHVSALQVQANLDSSERGDLRKKLSELDTKYRALYQYLYATIEHMMKNGVKPLVIPKELDTDQELIKLVGKK